MLDSFSVMRALRILAVVVLTLERLVRQRPIETIFAARLASSESSSDRPAASEHHPCYRGHHSRRPHGLSRFNARHDSESGCVGA